MNNSFVTRLEDYHDEGVVLREGLAHEGPKIVTQAAVAFGSLRGAARESCLSPAYLSRVRSGKDVISLQAYLTLARLVEAIRN